MPAKAIKSRQIRPKQRDLYTPEPVRGRVITRHMSGESNRQIAIAESIDRETVGRILSQQEVVQMVAQYQARALRLVPKAIAAYEEVLGSDNLHLKAAIATKLLEGLQVLHKGGIEQTIEIATRASPELEQKDRKCLVLGQIMQMAIERNRRFGIPAPELDELEKAAERRTEAPRSSRTHAIPPRDQHSARRPADSL
jgi:hypothetical protein